MNTGPEDTWTGTGILAYYDQETVTPAAFVGANWYFEREGMGEAVLLTIITQLTALCITNTSTVTRHTVRTVFFTTITAHRNGVMENGICIGRIIKIGPDTITHSHRTLTVTILWEVMHNPISKTQIIQTIDGTYLLPFIHW